MSKLKNKKMFIPIIIVFVLIALGILTFLLNKNDTKKLKGQAVEEPANTAFKDNEFYWCVLNAYNNENGTNYNINYSLSDEQLASIKNLKCSIVDITDNNYYFSHNGNINNYLSEYYYPIPSDEINYKRNYYYSTHANLGTGIIQEAYSYGYGSNSTNSIDDISGIELLTGLTYLELSYDMRKDIDLSNSKNLEILKLNWFKNVNLTNNTKLKDVVLFRGESITGLKEITNVEHLTIATMFEQENNISFYDDISYLTNLESLELYGTLFNNLNTIKNLNKITKLGIGKESATTFVGKLNELPYLENLTSLTWNGSYEETGELPIMANLKSLNITQSHRDRPAQSLTEKLDYFKFPSLTHLYLGGVVDNSITKISDLINFEKLTNLEYLDVRGFYKPLDGIEKLTKLKTLIAGNIVEVNTPCESIENLSGGVNDFSMLPNLKILVDAVAAGENNIRYLGNLEELYTVMSNYISTAALNIIEQFPNMKVFYDFSGGTSAPDIRKMPNIETHFAEGMDLIDNTQVVDLSNLKNLKHIYTGMVVKGVENLTELETLGIGAYDGSGNMSYDINSITNPENYYRNIVDLSNNKKLKTLVIRDNISRKIDISRCKELEYIQIENYDNFSLANIDFSNNSNLKFVKLKNNKLRNIDLSNNNKLIYFESKNNYFDDKSNMALVLNTKFSKKTLDVILPDNFIIKNISGSNNFLSHNNGEYTANALGTGNISIVYENVAPIAFINLTSINAREYVLNRKLNVIDVNSKEKTEVNKQKGYILTNSLIKEKDIIKDIKISPKGMENTIYSVIDENKFKIYNFRSEIAAFDLIKVASNKYLIDNDNIYYNGNFNLDNVEVSNATTSLNENKLDIIYNNEVIKTYNLIKKDNLLGDVNGDGKVSITDMTMQYKHVKYILDLEGDEEYRADLNSDEDISITDVTSLYKLIKGNVGE